MIRALVFPLTSLTPSLAPFDEFLDRFLLSLSLVLLLWVSSFFDEAPPVLEFEVVVFPVAVAVVVVVD